METDPDSVIVSSEDRVLAKCAGLHLNQVRKFAPPEVNRGRPDDVPQSTPESPQAKFHADMANMAADKANEKDKVRTLANAYSVRWGRVAGAALQANRTYGADLARGCVSNDFPFNFSQFASWQARQEAKKRQHVEEEQKRAQAEEEQKRVRAEELARGQSKVVDTASSEQKTASTSAGSSGVDYIAEAKKSALILGCPTSDVRVTGAEKNNILMSANCGAGKELLLTCDQSGLCLRR